VSTEPVRGRGIKMMGIVLGLAMILIAAVGVWNRVRDQGFEAQHPAPGRSVDASGVQVHVIDHPGAEPAVVCIHGNSGSALDFASVQALAGPKHRVVAVDRPGYGWSDRSEEHT